MALKAAMWVHGNVAQAESGVGIVVGYSTPGNPRGSGATFVGRDNAFRWYHFPITTPVILDGVRPKLTKVFLLYQTDSYAELKSVHVYDGASKIRAFDNLNGSGPHNLGIDALNTFTMHPTRQIDFGLGISVGVSFAHLNDGSILFSAAGADFET